MKRLLLVLCLLLLAGGAVAYGLVSGRKWAGAVLETPTACSLLPNGKQWVYRFQPPTNRKPSYGYGLQIRRSSKERDPRHGTAMKVGTEWVSKDAAEAVLASSLVVNAQRDEGVFAIQILDVRDFAENESSKNPLRLYGGVQMPGVSTRIASQVDFLVGDKIDGTSVKGTCDWHDAELCPLQFQTVDKSRVYHYDVVLVADATASAP